MSMAADTTCHMVTGKQAKPVGSPPVKIVNCKQKDRGDKDYSSGGPGVASRTAFMLLLVTAVFVLSWLPYWVINLMAMTSYFHDVSQAEILVALFFNSLFYINNAGNQPTNQPTNSLTCLLFWLFSAPLPTTTKVFGSKFP